MEENKKYAVIGGKVAKNAREDIENNLKESVISKENTLTYIYEEEIDKIENH